MAIFVKPANASSTEFVNGTSRYFNSSVLSYGERGLLTFEIYKREDIPASANDKFAIISKKYEYRPDLFSHHVYQTSDYWWRIMQANQIWDIFDFKAGKNIRVPFNIGF